MNEDKIHTFTKVSTQVFPVSQSGSGFDILAVGAGVSAFRIAGGGAGDYVYGEKEFLQVITYIVTVGAGGAIGGNNAGDSSMIGGDTSIMAYKKYVGLSYSNQAGSGPERDFDTPTAGFTSHNFVSTTRTFRW